MRFFFFFSSRRRHTRFKCEWSSDVCSSDLGGGGGSGVGPCATIGSIMCPPTPRWCRAFQRATSCPGPPDPLSALLLTQQPLRKIYSLRQFRHLAPQLLHGFEQFLLAFPVPRGG